MTVDLGWPWDATADGLLPLVFGALLLAVCGLHRLFGWRLGGRELERRLIAWKAAPAGGTADLQREIEAYYRSQFTTQTAVTGLALVLAALVLGLLAWSGHSPSRALGNAGTSGSIWLTQLVALVGIGLGYTLAVRLARRSVAVGPRYADLRQRRLADYRAPILGWLAPACAAIQAAVAVAFVVLLHDWRPLLVLPPAALAVAVGELHMRSTARVPRMVVAADPATARRCDDLIRATVIAGQQIAAFWGVAYGAMFGMSFVPGLPSYSSALPGVKLALTVLLLSAACPMLCSIGVAELKERLGGRITGWRWRPMEELA